MARNAPAHFAATVADHVDAVEGAPVPEGRQVHGKVKSAKAFPLCLSLRPIRVTLPKGGIGGRQRPSMAEESAGGHRLRDSLFLPLRALGKRRVCGWPLGLICRLRYWPRQFECPSAFVSSNFGVGKIHFSHILALWGNKDGLPSMKVQKLKKYQKKVTKQDANGPI